MRDAVKSGRFVHRTRGRIQNHLSLLDGPPNSVHNDAESLAQSRSLETLQVQCKALVKDGQSESRSPTGPG